MRAATSSLRTKHLLGIEPLTPEEITLILDTAEGFKEVSERPVKKVPALRGQLVINLFMEPSTRTRVSFEIAEKRLSADTLNFTASGSAVEKGETLIDTAENLMAMRPDMIVMRHKYAGAPKMLADRLPAAIINAGDGAHEHPTQALLDAFTIRERLGRLHGVNVSIFGKRLAQGAIPAEVGEQAQFDLRIIRRQQLPPRFGDERLADLASLLAPNRDILQIGVG